MIHETIDDTYEIDIPVQFGKYRFIKKIGGGAFSCVILVENVKTQEPFACKVVSRELLMKERILDRFEQELRILQTLDHPNIVKIHDIVFQELLIIVVMEYCSRGELFGYLLQNGILADFQIKHMLIQLVDALVYLHGRNIAHRDIKPENILLDADLNVKLADFGLCHTTNCKQLLVTPCGSPYYAPPEIISNIPYDGKKGDMWSLGVVIFTMATGALPWTEANQVLLLQQIVKANYVVPVTVSPNIRHLIMQLMDINPANRPSAEEVARLPWLQENFEMPFGKHRALGLKSNKEIAFHARASYGYSQPATASAVNKKSLIVRPAIPAGKARTICTVELAPIIDLVRKVPLGSRQVRRAKDDSMAEGAKVPLY